MRSLILVASCCLALASASYERIVEAIDTALRVITELITTAFVAFVRTVAPLPPLSAVLAPQPALAYEGFGGFVRHESFVRMRSAARGT